jgi:hypothetical protein
MDSEIQAQMHEIYELLDSLGNELRRLVSAKQSALQA